MDDILDILYDYSINNRIFDKEAISKILDVLLTINSFDDKISYLICKDDKTNLSNTSNGGVLGEFDMNSKIYIYYWEMLNAIRKNKYRTAIDEKYDLNSKETAFKKNMFILQTLFHELEHAKQAQIVDDMQDNSLEKKLYQFEINYVCVQDDVLSKGMLRYFITLFKHEFIYNMNYNISFMERMANIKSYEEICNLLLKLGNDFNKLYDIQKEVKDRFIVKDYKDGLIGPTTRFISNLGYTKYFTKNDLLEALSELSLDDRIRYGFRITEDEYTKKIKK